MRNNLLTSSIDIKSPEPLKRIQDRLESIQEAGQFCGDGDPPPSYREIERQANARNKTTKVVFTTTNDVPVSQPVETLVIPISLSKQRESYAPSQNLLLMSPPTSSELETRRRSYDIKYNNWAAMSADSTQ